MTVPAMMLSGVSPLPEPEQDDSGKVIVEGNDTAKKKVQEMLRHSSIVV